MTQTTTRKATKKQTTEKNAVENILSVHLWGNVALYRVRANAPLTEKAYASIQANKEQAKEHGGIYTGNEVIEPQEGVFFEVYQTVFVDGLAKSCSCPSKRPCYHELQLAPVEQEQAAKRRARRYEREQLARERAEFPYGLNVPAWAGMFGTIISDVFVNSEGIHGVEVLLEDGETRLVSILTLRFEQEDQEKREAGLVQAPNGIWMTPEQLANVPGAIAHEEATAETSEQPQMHPCCTCEKMHDGPDAECAECQALEEPNDDWLHPHIDPWAGMDEDEKYVAWANYERAMAALAS